MKKYTGKNLDYISYPLGGIGSGMLCLQGTGSFGSVSLRNTPNIAFEPLMFSAITIIGEENVSRVIEAPVPEYNIFPKNQSAGNGMCGKTYGLPRFSQGEFSSQFPFATLKLSDENMPIDVKITGWSPFVPNDEDSSSLPFAAIEYIFTNSSNKTLEAVYYFNATNFMKLNDNAEVRPIKNGFVLEQHKNWEHPNMEGAFCASVDENAYIDAAWFRGGWFDQLTMLWNNISKGICANKIHLDKEKGQSDGGTLSVPFKLNPNESKTIKLRYSWYVPYSDVRTGKDDVNSCDDKSCNCNKKDTDLPKYIPWYTTVIKNIEEADKMWSDNYDTLYKRTKQFTDSFYNSTLPVEIIDAVSANLSILKSPTLLRQVDGKIWGWEGCADGSGCCDGSCTHVWNYAQSICHLFPRLEKSLRDTEFYMSQDDVTGHQQFRTYLPIRKAIHDFSAASDGQLGGIIKVYRDWRISGDTNWLKDIWERVKSSLNFCINQWDTEKEGILKQPHHNTYDIEFWGPDGMCTSFYLGALKAAYEMGIALGDDCTEYNEIYKKGRKYLEENLFNGEYFYQKVMWEGLNTNLDITNTNNETRGLLEAEGPKYQYGNGCISDGVLGVWLSEISGLNDILDEEKLEKNLLSIYNNNFKKDLSTHVNTQRPGYALGKDAGLLLCTWPHGGKPSLPFVYCDEVFTGIEYQVASHLISKGFLQQGLDIVRGCRNRYNGTVRNPYNEYECGHWYARAMASYALLQAYTGVRYDNITKTLYVRTNNSKSYKTFLATATGYGNVEVENGKVNVVVVSGTIDIKKTVTV